MLCCGDKGQVEVIRQLAQHGANLDQTNNSGATPLFIAAQEGYFAVVDILLNAGVDTTLSMLSIAKKLRIFAEKRQPIQQRMALFLQDRADDEGILVSPYDIAWIMGHTQIAERIKNPALNLKQPLNCFASFFSKHQGFEQLQSLSNNQNLISDSRCTKDKARVLTMT